jgi:hypothetical protein
MSDQSIPKQSPNGSAPLPSADRGWLANTVETCGSVSAASRMTGLPVATLRRAVAGEGMRAGTHALVRQKRIYFEGLYAAPRGGDAA